MFFSAKNFRRTAVYDYHATVVATRTKQQVTKCCPPFGEQLTLVEPTDKVTENFTGKERDDETALNYFGARYLDPMLGLWVSVDPARPFASPYLYVGNGMNSVNVIDPDGNADLRIAVLFNYDQDKFLVDGTLLIKKELSKYNHSL